MNRKEIPSALNIIYLWKPLPQNESRATNLDASTWELRPDKSIGGYYTEYLQAQKQYAVEYQLVWRLFENRVVN